MGTDVEKAVALALEGRLFPQFADDWEVLYERESIGLQSLVAETVGRVRIGLACQEPDRLAALFLQLCQWDVDLFLFNPSWGASERDEALRVSGVEWEISDKNEGLIRLKAAQPASEATLEERSEETGFQVMIPTGGTGGRVKFSIHDWTSLEAAVGGLREGFGCEVLNAHCLLPLYHVSGFMQLVRAVLTGGTIVFGSLDCFAANHDLIFEKGVQGDRFVSLVPTQLERLLKVSGAPERLVRYRAVFVGGAACPDRLIGICRERGLPIALSYGMTETAALVAALKPEAFLEGNETSGQALPHARIEIVDEVSGEGVPIGVRGLIRVEADSCFRGYWGGGSEVKGAMMTTDRGFLDERGFLSVVGRSDRVIISGGEKIDLGEIERVIEETGLVRELVAFGVENEEWGEALAVAFVPRTGETTEKDLEGALDGTVSRFRIPKIWRRLETLPRNEAGKIDKARLIVD